MLDDELEAVYAAYGEQPDLLPAVERVLAAHGVDDARAAFERAGARDFLGREADAVPLYREALELGLGAPYRLQCLVQLGSSLRNGDASAAPAVALRALAPHLDRYERAVTSYADEL